MRLAASTLLALGALALGGCGDTVQRQPIAHSSLEGLVLAPYPVYWVGGSFEGLPVTEATHDPSGAVSLQYGNCLQGGQATCVPPLRVVTSPDNSFVPGGASAAQFHVVRGVTARVAQRGRTILIGTGEVVLSIYAQNAQLAAAAAGTAVPINRRGAPGEPLPAPLPDSGFGSRPLPSQVPPPLRSLVN